MFKMKSLTPANVGYSCKYKVIFDRPYTVRTFIDTVIENKPGEWGFIMVGKYGRCYYKDQKIIENDIPGSVLEKKIKSVTATNKHWQMDYDITLHDGPVRHEEFHQ